MKDSANISSSNSANISSLKDSTKNAALNMQNQLSVKSLHGTCLTYSDIKMIPERNSFIEPDIYAEINDKILKGKPLLFMPNSLHENATQEKKYDKAKYKIVLFGVLMDGRKASVMLNAICPYFEVVIKDGPDVNEKAIEIYNKLLQNKYTTPERFDISRGREFKGYNKEDSVFVRLYFNKLKTRTDAIKFIKSQGYITTTDDTSCYYRVVCRDYLSSYSSWIVISNYSIKTYDNIRGSVFTLHISDYIPYDKDITSDIRLTRDNTMSMCWDIETYSPDGQLPIPENKEHKVFMLSLTFQWYHSGTQLFRVCLVDHPCDPKPDYLTVVCGTEYNLLKAFGKIVYKMKPEFILGFNDSDYDWPWVIKRAKQYPGLLAYLAGCFDATKPWKNYDDEGVFAYNYKKEMVKLEADTYVDGMTLTFPGYINIDVRTIFRQIYPTAEKSNLNYYLSLNKLGGKNDMPYQEIFNIYKEMTDLMKRRDVVRALLNKLIKTTSSGSIKTTSSGVSNAYSDTIIHYIMDYESGEEFASLKNKLAEVADYCVIDSQRCHELMKIRSVITDKREIAKMSYTSMFDALYRANGMKVRNLVISRGQKMNIRFSNITDNSPSDEHKFPGAYVFPPKKGLVTSKVTIRERCESKMEKYASWSDVSESDIKEYYSIIHKYGSYIPEDILHNIIEERHALGLASLKKCFIDFLSEKNGRPITGLDFSSLYPSLIMTYNLSPEYMVLNKKQAKELHMEGRNLHKIKFLFNGRPVRGWSLRHNNMPNSCEAANNFGVYPTILKELFDLRSVLKKELQYWEHEKEKLTALPHDEFMKPENQEAFENVNFNYSYKDSKQKAIKLFMNTFYGESGNKRSPFFVIQLAGAVTSAGQYNIKMVQQHVEKEGCDVYYGDTDSIYSAMPEKYFIEIDKLYFTENMPKEQYWKELVNITFDVIKVINKNVNNMLKADNGTDFLKMAFEESLYPVAFLAKKKYYGIPHISVPNFNPKELFVRGLDMKKRGVSEFLRKICLNIMWDSVNINNVYSLLELVCNKIDSIYKSKWEFDDFIMTDIYKPVKQNIKVKTFVSRMLEMGISVKPYNRFNYVIVKKNPYKYDERGRKKEILIGDKMEYAHVAIENNMEIDLDYYMQGSINGQLARLITYYGIFHVEPINCMEDELKISDDKTYNNACKFIENYCSNYYTKYNSKGKIYQKIFKVANAIVTKKLNDYFTNEFTDIISTDCDLENIEKWIEDKSEKDAIKLLKNYGKKYIDDILEKLSEAERKVKVNELQMTYYSNRNNNLSQQHESIFNENREEFRRQIKDHINKFTNILNNHKHIIKVVQDSIKNTIHIEEKFNDPNADIPDYSSLPDVDLINEDMLLTLTDKEVSKLISNEDAIKAANIMRNIYINIRINYDFILKTRSIVDYLKMYRDAEKKIILKPKDMNIKKMIKENVDHIIQDMSNIKI